MKLIYLPVTLFIAMMVISCANTGKNFVIQVQPDGSKMIVGQVERDTLFTYFPEWDFEYKYYQPDPVILDSLQKIDKNIAVEIYLGTWCGDSRREVPHFFKILDTLKESPFERIDLWAVNREKLIPESDVTDQKNIERVATFIFKYGNSELGRIVERPSDLMESDILHILMKAGE
jgi:thiol-disulfide isomerase/thioredoxin